MIALWSTVIGGVFVLIPAFLALGSPRRRRLSLIRDELKTLSEIPEDHPARDLMSDRVLRSVEQYASSPPPAPEPSSRAGSEFEKQAEIQRRRSRDLRMAIPAVVLGSAVAVAYANFQTRLTSGDASNSAIIVAIAAVVAALSIYAATLALIIRARRARDQVAEAAAAAMAKKRSEETAQLLELINAGLYTPSDRKSWSDASTTAAARAWIRAQRNEDSDRRDRDSRDG